MLLHIAVEVLSTSIKVGGVVFYHARVQGRVAAWGAGMPRAAAMQSTGGRTLEESPSDPMDEDTLALDVRAGCARA